MEYSEVTVWTVIKRFILGWLGAGALLVVISCVKYREFILAAFRDRTLEWIAAMVPIVIVLVGISYMLKSVFTQ